MSRIAKLVSVQPAGPRQIGPYDETCTLDNVKAVVKHNVRHVLDLLESAGRERGDLVVTPEDILGGYCYLSRPDDGELFRSLAEPVPGPTTDQAGMVAKKYSMYVIVNILEASDGEYYNTSVLLDRRGKVLGKYHKVNLAPVETHYLVPGDEYPVFETDFAKVGMLICFDNFFPEPAACLALNGAEIIAHSTYSMWAEGEAVRNLRARSRACDHTVYWISSIYGSNRDKQEESSSGHSCIVDMTGNILAEAGYWADTWATAVIDLDRRRYHGGDAPITGIDDWKLLKLKYRRPATFKVICSKSPPVMKSHADLHVRSRQELQRYLAGLQDEYKKETTTRCDHDVQEKE